ncbi:YciI family protein [Solicola gregarius]|uniref:YciI family protein n=1 Tax=Solicola gregarius TaxID=2908642 RepID=A0AA46YNC4_9ACTN|nr:YciI family protein [Solicola gregarius]UYM06583.1 YciI family protein [Solicola gregarius]
MAHFVLTYAYNDTPLRAERRDDHLAHLDALHSEGALVLAGPLADRTGGIIILSAEDEAAAQQLVERDPYTKLDVTKDRELREWTITVGSLAQ